MKLVYKDHPRDQQNAVLIHRWSLYTGSITWEVYPCWPVKCGLYKQVVFIYRWSLEQVWLYMNRRSVLKFDFWKTAIARNDPTMTLQRQRYPVRRPIPHIHTMQYHILIVLPPSKSKNLRTHLIHVKNCGVPPGICLGSPYFSLFMLSRCFNGVHVDLLSAKCFKYMELIYYFLISKHGSTLYLRGNDLIEIQKFVTEEFKNICHRKLLVNKTKIKYFIFHGKRMISWK